MLINVITLPATEPLTIRHVAEMHQKIVTGLTEGDCVSIEFSNDVHADLSFIQLIESARIHAGSAGKTIALASPASGSVLDVLRRGGFLEQATAAFRSFWLHEEAVQ